MALSPLQLDQCYKRSLATHRRAHISFAAREVISKTILVWSLRIAGLVNGCMKFMHSNHLVISLGLYRVRRRARLRENSWRQ